jgi:exodeoxyribonuclease V beta subunit
MSNAHADVRVRVVEASAGTGKTFRITRMVVDMVSGGMPIDRIVLSSYTNAAAEELADRVRTALARALDPRSHGDKESALPDDAVAARLRRAIADLDSACIGTIHSFCARLLEEAAEVAGALSLEGMSPDEAAAEVQAEVTADLWAACVAPRHLAIAMLGDSAVAARETLAEIVSAVDSEPDARIEPDCEWTSIEELERRIDGIVCGDGARHRIAVRDIVDNFNARAASNLGAMADASVPGPEARRAVIAGAHELRHVDGEEWPEDCHAKKRGKVHAWALTPAGRDAVNALQQIDAGCGSTRAGFRASLARRARAVLAARRDASRTYSFGDLIERTWRLVSRPDSSLVAYARSRYEVAIIDECQDTDPLQQWIFRRIFDAPCRSMHVVGDPKQSIYGFRGADLPSYIQLRDSGLAEDPLATSFRSDAAHVAAVEGLFTGSDAPFGTRDIAFTPVGARHAGPRCVGGDGSGQSGMEVIALDAGTAVAVQRQVAIRATAARIRQWLSLHGSEGLSVPEDPDRGETRRPVRPGDIAVLCQRREDLDVMRRELGRLGIPSVHSGDSSVLLTPAAEELHAILAACASRRSAHLALGAAISRALGASANDVRDRRESWVGAIRSCARTLERHGVDAALLELLERPIPGARSGPDAERSALELLLSQPGGERHAVDLQHLRELLGDAERLGTHGAAALAQWIRAERDAAMRAQGRSGGDTARLRTQATRDAVTLQTLHSSKGLTYALVCLPTIGIGARAHGVPDVVRATEPSANGDVARIIDLGSPSHAARAAHRQQEQHRERTRLLYVAMTRARYLTCLCVPMSKGSAVAPSALEELLEQQRDASGAAAPDRMAQLAQWSARADGVHARLLSASASAAPERDSRGLGESSRGHAVRIVTDVPAWSGAPWTPPAAASIAPLDPPVQGWRDPLREMSFTSLARGAGHGSAAAADGATVAEREIDERADPEPDVPSLAGADLPADDAPAFASDTDDAFRRMGVRGVELGVAVHAALERAFPSLGIGDGDAASGISIGPSGDQLAAELCAELSAASGGELGDPARAAAHDAARAMRASLSQPLGASCPSVVELARRHTSVHRELRISVPLEFRRDAVVAAFRSCGGEVGQRVAPALARVPAARLHGLLSGIIDIAACTHPGAWHIIDWKTNDLGRRRCAYEGASLEDAAVGSLYPVQAAIYMMLLSRWLRRIGDSSEVVASHYLYMRGIDAHAPGSGIWSWSPGSGLLEALDDAMSAPASAAAGGAAT